MGRHYLESLFAPAAIAVFGEGEGSPGDGVCQSLKTDGFAGPVYALAADSGFAPLAKDNPAIDLAVIATPTARVPGLIRACGERRVKAAIVLSTDYAPAEPLAAEARRQGVRLLGPNGLGLMRPAIGLNASLGHAMARRGPLALVSQSGAICTAILDWANAHGVGFSAVVSLGDGGGVDIGDILDYLSTDLETRAILLYLEGVRDARRFMSGLRAAARMKPVVAVKAGRHAGGARAALAHTGLPAGADDVFNAALERAGAVRAGTIGQMFAAARLLSTPCRAKGNRLAIVTNAGGPGVMAADWAAEKGVALAEPGEAALRALDAVLPKHWSRGNPLDLQGEAAPRHYLAAIDACLADEGVDGVLAMLTPQALTEPTETAQALAQAANPRRKPILACWLGGPRVQAARDFLDRQHIPSFANPESAVAAFGFLAAYRRNQELLLQAPGPLAEAEPPDVAGTRLVIEGALAEQRDVLSWLETRAVLRAFGIPLLPALIAHTPNEALAAAECLGFPVAMKILSPDIGRKSEVGGVRLDINSAQSVRQHFTELCAQVRALRPEARIEGVSVEQMHGKPRRRELSAGILHDPAFGPVIRLGAGGMAANLFEDRAVALPPLNRHLARAMIGQARIAQWLGQCDLEALERVLLRVSAMACELPHLATLDIDPLAVDEDGAWALDARLAVREPPPCRRPYDHMAIHPYPSHWADQLQLADGTAITLRPIRPEDADMEQAFVRRLSPQAKYFRFMDTLRELSQEELVRLTQLDYARDLALIATVRQDGQEMEIGVARYFTNPDGESGEFALVVDDAWQGLGLGTKLMGRLVEAARERNFRALQGEVLADNLKMLRLADKLGFSRRQKPDEPGVVAVEKML
jgi:acetyltransferase